MKTEWGIYFLVKKLFGLAGFKERNYLLRHYGYKKLKEVVSDYDFREWLMGHRERVSAIYYHRHYLIEEEIKQYKTLVDTRVLAVYSVSKQTEEIIDIRIDIQSIAEKIGYGLNKST